MHAHRHLLTRTHMHSHARAHSDTHSRARTHTRTHGRTHTHTRTHTYTHTHTHTHTRARTHTHTHIYTHTHTHTHVLTYMWTFGHTYTTQSKRKQNTLKRVRQLKTLPRSELLLDVLQNGNTYIELAEDTRSPCSLTLSSAFQASACTTASSTAKERRGRMAAPTTACVKTLPSASTPVTRSECLKPLDKSLLSLLVVVVMFSCYLHVGSDDFFLLLVCWW